MFLIALPLQQWLYERASILPYTHIACCCKKCRAVFVYAMKAYIGSRGIAPIIHIPSTRLKGVASIASSPILPTGKNREMWGPRAGLDDLQN